MFLMWRGACKIFIEEGGGKTQKRGLGYKLDVKEEEPLHTIDVVGLCKPIQLWGWAWHRLRDPLPRQHLHLPARPSRQWDASGPGLLLQRRHCQHLLPGHHQVLPPVSNNRVDIVKKEQSSCCAQCDNLYKTATYINVSSKSHKFFFYNRSMFG